MRGSGSNGYSLDESDTFRGHWNIESFDPSFFLDLKDLIGSYRIVSPAKLNEFFELAESFGYKIAFFDDPTNLMDHYEALNERPDVALNSRIPQDGQWSSPVPSPWL